MHAACKFRKEIGYSIYQNSSCNAVQNVHIYIGPYYIIEHEFIYIVCKYVSTKTMIHLGVHICICMKCVMYVFHIINIHKQHVFTVKNAQSTKLLTPHTTEKKLPIFMTSSKKSKAPAALFWSLGNPIPIDFHDPQQKSTLRSRATRNEELRNCNVTPKQAAAVHVNLRVEHGLREEWGKHVGIAK